MLTGNIINKELVVSFVEGIVIISMKCKINKGWLYRFIKTPHTLLRKCTENLKFIKKNLKFYLNV